MSYLGLPRLHFAGSFQADVPTVNNVDQYHDNNLFEPRFQRLQTLPDQYNGLFNPRGSGAFRLRHCRVTGVVRPDGRLVTSPAEDAVVGAHLCEDNLRVSAKMVDLSPHVQTVSEIYGLRIRLQDADGAEFLRAAFEPAAVADVWQRQRVASGWSDPGGAYQSVLSQLQWSATPVSPFLRMLRESTHDNLLSVKFNVDGVGVDPAEPEAVCFGRIVGSIGPYHAGEPWQFVAARRLRPVPGEAFNPAPCLVDESGTVFVDLGNSVQTVSRGGPLVPLGPLRLALLAPDDTVEILAPLRGIDDDFYPTRAAIASASLDPRQRAAALDRPLVVVDSADPPRRLLAESADGRYLRADRSVFRVFPGTSADRVTTTMFATRFGRPAPGVEILVAGGQKPPPLDFPVRLATDAAGRAEFWLTSGDPQSPRPYIDGASFVGPYGFADRPAQAEGTLAVRVFEPFEAPPRPTWVRDIQPIFQQYANLYPAMRDVFDLANYHHVVRYRQVIRASLLSPVASPNHMPVSRDLSPGKRDMIVKWLDAGARPAVLDIDDPPALRAALQQALLLEQAVIPPYLAALFSIKAGHNTEVAEIISDVVREEMLHMALVANLLNAVGGQPRIGRPSAVPTYPGRLPGPVLPDLTVRLRRCSLAHIRDVFMAIEQPEYPVVDGRLATAGRPDVTLDPGGKVLRAEESSMRALEDWFTTAEYEPMTIGWFYNQIARAIWRLDRDLTANGGSLFTGDPARQVSWPSAPGRLYQVTDRRSALLAIYEIIEQGEGSPQNLDHDPDADRLGHYYRFQEIVEGRRLVRDRAGKWVFAGAPIRFDPDGVHPMLDDPDTYRLPAGSVARRESELCDEMYTNLLTALNRVFNGHPGDLPDAVGLMFSMQVQAKKLLDLPSGLPGSTVVGPAFQSPGVILT